MKKGDTRDFLETIASQDAWLRIGERGFFVNGCCTFKDKEGVEHARLEIYEMGPDLQTWVQDVCSITKPTVQEAMEEFLRIPLIDGKTFWELEPELEWV
ncbi:MAG: hypothetical protein IJS32_04790 [Kiritimatiellae bacterium]|nr:hypothetical protein [Kiritimatiellia bacterium]